MKIEQIQENMLGKTFAHKANDDTRLLIGTLVKFESINGFNIPILLSNGEELACMGIVFEYTDFLKDVFAWVPVYKQYELLKQLKMSFNAFRDINPNKNN